MAPSTSRIRTGARETLAGARFALVGVRTWATWPRLFARGLLPGLITVLIFGAGATVLVSQLAHASGAIAEAIVSEDSWWQDAVQAVAAVAILAGAAVIAVYTFTAVTLVIGQPVFDRLSRTVDQRFGFTGEEPAESWWRSTLRGLGEALRLAVLTVPLAIALFVVGFIPVVGGALALLGGATVGGWFLALELTASPLARRSVTTLQQRRVVLARRRPLVIGFGAAVFLMFLVPLGAIVFMPAAVTGATLLAAEVTRDTGAAQGATTGSGDPSRPL